MRKERCPICLFKTYEVYGGGYDPPEPAEGGCNRCGMSWMQPGNEDEAVRWCVEALTDDPKGEIESWLTGLWLPLWLMGRAWWISRRINKAAKK